MATVCKTTDVCQHNVDLLLEHLGLTTDEVVVEFNTSIYQNSFDTIVDAGFYLHLLIK
jgi:sulfur carrier protein ThiS